MKLPQSISAPVDLSPPEAVMQEIQNVAHVNNTAPYSLASHHDGGPSSVTRRPPGPRCGAW